MPKPTILEVQSRKDGRHQVAVDGYVLKVHWDQEVCTNWAYAYCIVRSLKSIVTHGKAEEN